MRTRWHFNPLCAATEKIDCDSWVSCLTSLKVVKFVLLILCYDLLVVFARCIGRCVMLESMPGARSWKRDARRRCRNVVSVRNSWNLLRVCRSSNGMRMRFLYCLVSLSYYVTTRTVQCHLQKHISLNTYFYYFITCIAKFRVSAFERCNLRVRIDIFVWHFCIYKFIYMSFYPAAWLKD